MRLLELDRVVKRFTDVEDVVCAVDEVTLVLEAGKIAAVYGPSGSGKTTLLLLAGGLLAPDSGRVCFAGKDLASLSASELAGYQRRELGFVYQSTHLMSGVPAVENAAVKLLADGVPLRRARAVACDWLERVGLANRLEHTPEQLSGGERRRVAIARALANGPRLILADEPTGDLDSQRGSQILNLLAAIAREDDAAVLIVTHDPQVGTVAQRVYGLRDGRLQDPVTGAEGQMPASIKFAPG